MRRASESPELDTLDKDFENMGKIQTDSVEVIQNTWIANAGDDASDATVQYVVHDLTMGSDRCKDIQELRNVLRPRKLLGGGRSGSFVVQADEGKVIFKNVGEKEFASFAPIIVQREAMRSEANETALYHTSMLSPVCWGLSELRHSDAVWIVMPNLAVPSAAALESACGRHGLPPVLQIFDIKGKWNNGPIRSPFWQRHFGKRADWEYGLETSFPGGFSFQSNDSAHFFYQSLQSDVEALTARDVCDYSLMVVAYGCKGSEGPIAKLTSNAYDFSMRTRSGEPVRISMSLIDFGLKYGDIPLIEKWVGGKGWSSLDYGAKLKAYVRETMNLNSESRSISAAAHWLVLLITLQFLC